MDTKIANDAVVINSRIVRGVGAGVAPVPVQPMAAFRGRRAQRIEQYRAGVQNQVADYGDALADFDVGIPVGFALARDIRSPIGLKRALQRFGRLQH